MNQNINPKTKTATHDKVVRLTLLAMFSAIIIVMTFVPYVGYITLGVTLSITTLHIPVIIGAITLGPVGGAVLGTVWGLSCLVYALSNRRADAVIFTNPLISVIPRIIVGYLIGWYYVWFKKIIKNHYAAAIVVGVLGTITHTALVITAINLFGGSGLAKFGAILTNIIEVAFTLNCGVEILLCVLLVPPITKAIQSAFQKNNIIN